MSTTRANLAYLRSHSQGRPKSGHAPLDCTRSLPNVCLQSLKLDEDLFLQKSAETFRHNQRVAIVRFHPRCVFVVLVGEQWTSSGVCAQGAGVRSSVGG